MLNVGGLWEERLYVHLWVEPSTFRFSVLSSPDRSNTTWHFACRSYVVKAPEALRALELLDSPLDTARPYVVRARLLRCAVCSATQHSRVVDFAVRREQLLNIAVELE